MADLQNLLLFDWWIT